MSKRKKQFSKIYDQEVDKIYRFVYLKVSSKEKAEDITSETFSRVWSVFQNEDREIDNVGAFLYKTAKNLVIDYYRQQGQALIVPTEDIPLVDETQNIAKEAMDNSDMRNVRTALASLNEDYQNAIIWYYLDDLSVPKIAEMLGRTESATRVLIHRALNSLRDNIKEV